MCILFYTDILRGMHHGMHRSATGEYSTDVTMLQSYSYIQATRNLISLHNGCGAASFWLLLFFSAQSCISLQLKTLFQHKTFLQLYTWMIDRAAYILFWI